MQEGEYFLLNYSLLLLFQLERPKWHWALQTGLLAIYGHDQEPGVHWGNPWHTSNGRYLTAPRYSLLSYMRHLAFGKEEIITRGIERSLVSNFQRKKISSLCWLFKKKKMTSHQYVGPYILGLCCVFRYFHLAKADGLLTKKKLLFFWSLLLFKLHVVQPEIFFFFYAIRPGNLPYAPKYQRWWCHDRSNYLTMEKNAMEREHLKQQKFLQHSQLKSDPNILP